MKCSITPCEIKNTTYSTVNNALSVDKLLKHITVFEADVLAICVVAFIILLCALYGYFWWRKRKSEQRHRIHKLQPDNRSISVNSDVSEAYTTSAIIQEINSQQSKESEPITPCRNNVFISPEQVKLEAKTMSAHKKVPYEAVIKSSSIYQASANDTRKGSNDQMDGVSATVDDIKSTRQHVFETRV